MQGNTPVYVYFQSTRRTDQTLTYVRKTLLRQLLMSDISNPPNKALLDTYETAKSRDTTLSEDFFIDLIIKFSKLFGKVVVFFDALDECDPQKQVDICEIINKLNTGGIWTYVTARSHTVEFLRPNLTPEPKYLPIAARDEDVQNFVWYEMRRRTRGIGLRHDVERDMVSRITEGVDGMYILCLSHCSLTIGFYWQD
jgi:hypothetical protein